jgi:mannose-1-phosphate guanylyltransferase/mannose-1-phosphate guanylyltransferase/phosphomannomutase
MVLAAGLGTRLRPVTWSMPKPMVPVLNRPVMEHTLRLLAGQGFREAIANLHWFPGAIEGRFGDGSALGVELTYRREERLLGTAGGVRNVADFLGDSFLVVAGDALTDIDFVAMREFHESHDGLATIATKRVPDTDQYGVVIAGDDSRIQGFQEKPDPAEALSDLANTCIYMFRAEVFDHFPAPGTSRAAEPDDDPAFADWAMDVFPALLERDIPFYSHEIDAYWNDIGNLDELRQGNFDALRGAVQVDSGLPEVAEGVRSGSPLAGGQVEGPALLGEDVRFGEGARVVGPAVVGDGCVLGEGCWVRDAILLEGTQVPPGEMLAGGIAGPVEEPSD